jgi:hypothetical protein
MYVYNDFYAYRSGVYSYTTGSYVGAHAVLTVGYDDEKQAFIVKNSWGSGWGEAGYFMIAYSEVGGTSRFGYSALVYDGYHDNNGGTCLKANPTVTLSPSATQSVTPGTAITYTVSVTNNDNSACPNSDFSLSVVVPIGWTATFGSSAISLSPGAKGSTILSMTSPITAPEGFYTASVKAMNSAAQTYEASASVIVQIQTVSPDPLPSSCSYSISPTSKTFKATGGSAAVNITSETGCTWTATSSDPWVVITSTASGSGSGKLYYTVEKNTSTAPRTATLTIAGKSYTVRQEGAKLPR